MKLIFERSVPGRRRDVLPQCDVPVVTLDDHEHQGALHLLGVPKQGISRRHTELVRATHGVNDGFYPLGSRIMKYNLRINEEVVLFPKFIRIHPLQPESGAQGCLEVLKTAETLLCEITGMDEMSSQPAVGAHGKFTGLLLTKACRESRGDKGREKIIAPDSAHSTNPANAVVTGFEVVNIPSQEDDCVDLERLRVAVGEDTAGLMLINPNTVGLFDKNILDIARITHEAGGPNYYDGANLSAAMGIVRPGGMGFDVIHLNLHETLSIPHGGGGSRSGPAGYKELLAEFLSGKQVVKAEDDGYHLGQKASPVSVVKSLYGNFLAVVKVLTYVAMLGKQGIPEASRNTILNVNYIRVRLSPYYHMPYQEICMHKFAMNLEQERHKIDVSAMDIAKALLDYGTHPSTMYSPLIVHEALTMEPAETESRENLDGLTHAFMEIRETTRRDPEKVCTVPHFTMVGRLDEVVAVKNSRLWYELETECDC